MTIQELYATIGGDYDAAIKIMRRDRLVDRTVRRFASSNLCADLVAATESGDPTAIFEAAHALKGVSANLGLTDIYKLTETVTDEFRAGNTRSLSDEEVKAKVAQIDEMCQRTVAAIKDYEAEQDA